MRKKVLFLIGNLESGGVSKSMVSLLNAIDLKKYDVSLWIGQPRGIFYSMAPNNITIVSDKRISWLTDGPRGLLPLLKSGHLLLFVGSLLRLLLSQIDKGYAGWWLSRLMPVINDAEYDMIVDYNGQHQLYYMVDKLRGKKKITFFHSDYSKWAFYFKMDKRYYPKVDYIFTISTICVQSLKTYFPGEADKIKIMENITSPKLINALSRESINDFSGEGIKILTIGHTCTLKGSDLAIKAAAIIKSKGIKFKWYFLGKELEDFHALIEQFNVKDNIVYLGLRANPYPYLKQADIYAHPSKFEGKSIALDEAKILCKPIVVTNFSTVADQFENRVNASICEMTPESLASAILELIEHESLRWEYSSYLSAHIKDNSKEIEKLYRIIDN